MNAIQMIKTFGPLDAKSIQRDPLLRWMVVVPLALALGMRWVVPVVFQRFGALIGFDLQPYYPPLMAYFVLLLLPCLAGVVVGFLLLDERDDGTLTALQVTPLTLNGYLIYRLSAPVVLSVLITAAVFPLTGLSSLNGLELLAAALGAAPMAPLTALYLASFAANKVQGFALMKASGVILMPPLVAYFFPEGWTLLLGLIPTYWPARLYWSLAAGTPNAWIFLIAGLVYQSWLVARLVKRFNRIMSQ